LNQIDARLQKVARNVFADDSLVLTDSTKPVEVSRWDSLGHVSFMLSVETEFAVEFSDDELVGFEDIGGLKHMLAEKLV
jgi:acyl carrier protein